MQIRRIILRAAALGLLGGILAGEAAARQEALLDLAKGQTFNDTGSDGATKYSIVDLPELGGQALKVVFAPGDSAGDRSSRIRDWKPFIALQFDAYNPGQEKVRLTLTIKHKRTTSFQTRVDMPVVLQPGKTAVKIGIDEMTNVNGSAPDLSSVGRWYIAAEPEKAPTVYFGTFWLVGDDLPAAASAPAGAAAGPLAAGPAPVYRIKGTIGQVKADLIATPDSGAVVAAPASPSPQSPQPSSAAAKGPAKGSDPARLVRLRAAKMPPVSKPVLFHTPEADAIVAALEVFPPDNPWNQVVAEWPLHPNSKNLIGSIGVQKPLRCNSDMGFVLVPPDQPRQAVKIVDYAGESDSGPFPIPDNTPIEGWPACFAQSAGGKQLPLDDVQRDALNQGGDRHGIVVDPVNRMLYEFYQLKKTATGWQAAQSSIFDLKTNRLRPDGWTSSDAAGLPIFPSVVRYDELQRGEVEHALRVTIRKSRRAYVAPATHYASRHEDENLPRMGERIRLRRDFDVSGFSPEVRTILKALKKYGMFVADNGIEWAISVAPDPRIPVLHEELRRVKGADFEVVVPPDGV